MSKATRHPENVSQARVRCPGCGYDQRGVVAAWSDFCPLQGRCAECGLEWRWTELLSVRVHRSRWCVEYAPHWWNVPWRAIKTVAMMFVPWRFWAALKMSDEPRWGRICAACLVSLLLAYFYVAGELARAALWDWQQYYRNSSGVSSRVNPITTMAHAAFMPWSDLPTGQTVIRNGATVAYWPTPRRIAEERFPQAPQFVRGPQVMKTLVFPFFMAVLIPVGMVLIPKTVRSATVQFHHVLRITMYSAAIPLMALPWLAHRYPTANYFLNRESYWGEIAWFMFVIIPMALAIWWGFAFQHYLRLRHAWPTAILLTFIAWLIPMLLGYFWFIFTLRPGILA